MSLPHSGDRYLGKAAAATVDERQRLLNSVTPTKAASHSQNGPEESHPVRPTFREDFLQEHSRFGKQAGSIEFVSYF